MGVGCGGLRLNRIGTNNPLNSIGDIFKNNVVGSGRYHTNPTDLLSSSVDQLNPIGFLTAGGNRGGSLMSQLTAGTAMPGQQSFGRLFSKIPKTFGF